MESFEAQFYLKTSYLSLILYIGLMQVSRLLGRLLTNGTKIVKLYLMSLQMKKVKLMGNNVLQLLYKSLHILSPSLGLNNHEHDQIMGLQLVSVNTVYLDLFFLLICVLELGYIIYHTTFL